MAAASVSLQIVQGSSLRSHFPFLGQSYLPSLHQRSHSLLVPKESRLKLKPYAKFNLSEILGGRGICNGEQGLQQELERNVSEKQSSDDGKVEESGCLGLSSADSFPEDAFEKELMGLTGGFPGGEKGLQQFIQQNPPPKKQGIADSGNVAGLAVSEKPKPP